MIARDASNVIVRFPNWLGDCIMALPFIGALHDMYPELDITIVVRGNLADIFQHDPRIREVIRIDDKQGLMRLVNVWRIAQNLRRKRYDYGFILPDSLSSAYLFYAGHILERIGYENEVRSTYLTWELPQPDKIIHRSQKYLNLLNELGKIAHKNYFPEIYTDPKSSEKAQKLLAGISRYVVIAPQTRAPSRRWGEDKYAQLATRIKQELNLDIVLIGAPDESLALDQVAESSAVECLNTASQSELLTSYEIMKNAIAYVGNDSGGAHLGGASGTFTISISGADNPAETHPLVKHGRVIKKELPCSPCVKNICPRRDHPNECMDLISVDEVFSAVCEAVNGQ